MQSNVNLQGSRGKAAMPGPAITVPLRDESSIFSGHPTPIDWETAADLPTITGWSFAPEPVEATEPWQTRATPEAMQGAAARSPRLGAPDGALRAPSAQDGLLEAPSAPPCAPLHPPSRSWPYAGARSVTGDELLRFMASEAQGPGAATGKWAMLTEAKRRPPFHGSRIPPGRQNC